jgi:hypothetical protein
MVEALLQDMDKETLASLITEIRGLGRDLAPALKDFTHALELQGKEQS